MPLLDKQPGETDGDWRARTTPPTEVNGDAIPYDDWKAQLVPIPGQDYAEWKERVSQKHAEELAPMVGQRRFETRLKQILPRHPDHAAQAAAVRPGGGLRPGAAASVAAPAATIELEDIPSFSPSVVQVEINVGHPASFPPSHASAKKRIKLFFYYFPIAGVADAQVKQNIRRRTLKWVRRNYAQANLTPRIVGIQPLPWPAQDTMLSFNAYHKNMSDLIKAPSTAPTDLSLTIEKTSGPSETISIHFEAAATLRTMAEGTRTALEPRGYSVEVREVPPLDHGVQPSWDLLIQHTGAPVSIRNATLTVQPRDANLALAVQVPRMIKTGGGGGPEQVDGDDTQIGGSPMQRRILYSGAHQAGCINVFLVPAMEIHGRAYPAYSVLRAEIKPRAELADAAIMAYKSGGASAMNETDQYPFVLSHEIDHVLAETGHSEAEGDLMRGKADPQEKVIKTNSVAGSKRIYSAPLLVGSDDLRQVDSDTPIPRADQDMAADMYHKGARFLESW